MPLFLHLPYVTRGRTRVAASALAERGEVQGLAHGQLGHVLVLLRHIHRRALRDKLAQLAPVVRHPPLHLHMFGYIGQDSAICRPVPLMSIQTLHSIVITISVITDAHYFSVSSHTHYL